MIKLDRRAAFKTVLGVAAASPLARAAAIGLANPIAETTAGKVRGYTNRGVSVFRGIPYAGSTTGENRFQPPVKPEPWAGIRNCFAYGHSCPQAGTGVAENDKGGSRNTDEDAFLLYRTRGWSRSEDCLRLNVWTPSASSGPRKRPVMVYMHGGGFTGGSGNDLLAYDGENLARHHDVVVITHNHRLNLFGFLNLAEAGGERYAASGNAGMLDNVAVLEWVRDNIANFGGDPGNVMIYGQSGGGGKVNALMGMPAAKGLFHRAVVQSGSMMQMANMQDSGRMAAAVLAELSISPSQLDKIRTIPTSALCSVQVAVQRRLRNTGASIPAWGPVVDGKILPATPFGPEAPAISANVPLMIGTCLNEFVNGTDNPERDTLTDAELMKRVTDLYKGKAGDIVAAYRKEYPKASPFTLWATISTAGVRHSAITQAERRLAQQGAPVYMYLYAWRTPALGGSIGTFHSSEIAFVFDNADLCANYAGGDPAAVALSHKMGDAWASMARSGKPGWAEYNQRTRACMVFDSVSAVRNDPEGEGLRLIG